MYKINSGFRWSLTASADSQVFLLPVNQQDIDFVLSGGLDEQEKVALTCREKQFANLIANFLIIGVLLASSVVLFGGISYLLNQGSGLAEYHIFREISTELRSPITIVAAALSGNAQGIIQLGILLLIATPIIRVIISGLTFLVRGEFVYIIITSLVISSLTYSLFCAYN
jgi:uncharacterized membrane protein